MPGASSIMVNGGAFQSLGQENRPVGPRRMALVLGVAGKSLPCQRALCAAMKDKSLFRDRLAPAPSAPATVNATGHPAIPPKGFCVWNGWPQNPRRQTGTEMPGLMADRLRY